MTRSHLQVACYRTCTDRRALTGIYYCVVATCHGVGELLHHVTPHLKIYVADIPPSAYLRGQTVGILQLDLCLVLRCQGVSQIGGIARLIIEVAVVAQQCRHTCAFGIERRHVERVALVHQRLSRCGIDEPLSLNGEIHVSQCVDGGKVAKVDVIAYLGFLWV